MSGKKGSKSCRRSIEVLHDRTFADMLRALIVVSDATERRMFDRNRFVGGFLSYMNDEEAKAACVVMYVGRDGYRAGDPYDWRDIDREFIEWWEYLAMDGEHFAREIMTEKWPLSEYLRKGAYMFQLRVGEFA